jgi:hypothetical protein
MNSATENGASSDRCCWQIMAPMQTGSNKIKLSRRIAARYDKLAAEYLAFIKLASIRIWLRAYEPTPWKPPLRETPFTAPQSDHYQPGNCTAKT